MHYYYIVDMVHRSGSPALDTHAHALLLHRRQGPLIRLARARHTYACPTTTSSTWSTDPARPRSTNMHAIPHAHTYGASRRQSLPHEHPRWCPSYRVRSHSPISRSDITASSRSHVDVEYIPRCTYQHGSKIVDAQSKIVAHTNGPAPHVTLSAPSPYICATTT